ncbi:MAG: patatin family protein [Clostridia bacterium]
MLQAGLVLEGGGMRGSYSAGVLDYFTERGLYFHHVIGVSAGALNSLSYITGQMGRNLTVSTRFCKDKRYLNPWGVLWGRVFNFDFMFGQVTKKLVPFDYEGFHQCREIRSTAVVTNCLTGKAEYLDVRDVEQDRMILQASSSLPYFAEMVKIKNQYYLDGGVADSIPLDYSLQSGNQFNVVVLTREEDYHKKPSKFAFVAKLRYRKYPQLVSAMQNRYQSYNQALALVAAEERLGNAVVIRPSKKLKVSRFERNAEVLQALHQLGYEDAKAKYAEISSKKTWRQI